MRKGLLTEVIEAFAQAKRDDMLAGPLSNPELDALREEVLGLLREGDRLRRRAEGPPSSGRSASERHADRIDDAVHARLSERNPDNTSQNPPETSRRSGRPGAHPMVKDAS